MVTILATFYGAAHVSLFIFGGLLVAYLFSGTTDYGGTTGFLPGASLGAFADPAWREGAQATGSGPIAGLRLLLGFFDQVIRLPLIFIGFFTFDYPVLQAVGAHGAGSYAWVKTLLQAIGTGSSMAMAVWLLRLGFASGILSNRYGLIAIGLVSLGGVGSVIYQAISGG